MVPVVQLSQKDPYHRSAFGLTMIPNHPRLVNDGLSSSLLNFIVYDQYGYQIANEDIELEIISETDLPSRIKTNS